MFDLAGLILKQEEIFCDREKSSDASISPPKRIKLCTTSANKDGCDSPLRRNILTTEIIVSPNKQTDVNAASILKGNSSNCVKGVSDHEHESNVAKCKKSYSSARRKRQAPSLLQSPAVHGSHCNPIVVMSPDKQTDAKAGPILKGNSALHVSYCSPEQKSEDIIAFVKDEILKNNEIEIRAHVKYRNKERSAFKVTVPNVVSAEILRYQWPAPIKIQFWAKE
uniref:Uncharacterized protein n=1 Tax=Glossina austeni TaxID=7395 RepID=A0A1A9VAH8_GLOAU